MTTAFRDVRSALTRRVRRVTGRRSSPPRPIRVGAPAGLPFEVLQHCVLQEFGTAHPTVHHQHLSGWKSAGAFRLMIGTGTGRHTLFFKDARYTEDHISALAGLPVRPGLPEFTVYSTHRDRLARWLPRVLWSHADSSGERYRYLLEDLGTGYSRPSAGPDLVTVCERLPLLHADLAAALAPAGDRLLCYDGDFAEQLLGYAHDALSRYRSLGAAGGVVYRALRQWPTIEARYRRAGGDARERFPMRTVHGDLNLANVLLARGGSGEVRLLDWEWAGTGIGHFDLAAALKAAPRGVRDRALEAYRRAARCSEPYTAHQRAFEWCRMQRGLLDAGFLARQRLDGPHSAYIDLDRHIEAATRHVLTAATALRESRTTTRRPEGSAGRG